MTEELKDLGRRAIACRGWKWMDGMLDGNIHEERYNAEHEGFLERDCDGWGYRGLLDGSLPDFSDPATLGCLLALVRNALRDDTVYARIFPSENRWCVCSARGMGSVLINRKYLWGDTEAEALVVALEAADAL